MKKLSLILVMILSVTQTAFANPWTCAKVSTSNKGESLDVTMSCTDGISAPVVLTRPVFRPERKADVKNAMRNVAIELRDKTNAITKVSTVKGNVDADASLIASENDPTV